MFSLHIFTTFIVRITCQAFLVICGSTTLACKMSAHIFFCRNHMGPFGTMKWTDGRCYEGQFRDGISGLILSLSFSFFGSFSSTILYCTKCLQYQTMLPMLWTVFGKRLCPLVRQEAWRRQAFLAWWTIVHRQGRIWELEDMQSCPIKRDLSTISIRTYRIQGMTSQSSLFVLD